MHIWGDGWPYWSDLYTAEVEIYTKVKKYTRCNLISKEKYGSIRYEYMIAPGVKLWYENGLKGKLRKWWSHSWITHLWVLIAFRVAKRAIHNILKYKPYLATELLQDAVIDERFGYPKYMEKLLGWRSVGDWKPEDDYE